MSRLLGFYERTGRAALSNPLGKKVWKGLKLPEPAVELRRTVPNLAQPLSGMSFALTGSDAYDPVGTHAGKLIRNAGGSVVHAPTQGSSTVDGLVVDCRDMSTVGHMVDVFNKVHGAVSTVRRSGRVLFIAPLHAQSLEHRAAIQALDGFNRALSKELGPLGSTSNLLLTDVEPGVRSEQGSLEDAVGFFLSPASAFVSGQPLVVRRTESRTEATEATPRDVCITGASRGIGASIVDSFARRGERLILVDHPSTTDDLEAMAGRLREKGVAAHTVAADLCSHEAVEQVASAVTEVSGGVDVVIHNAGIIRDRTFRRMSSSRFAEVLRVNAITPFSLTRRLLLCGGGRTCERGPACPSGGKTLLRENGRLVFLSSINGIAGQFGQTNYSTSKAAVAGFAKAFATHEDTCLTNHPFGSAIDGCDEVYSELRERKVTVNAVAPGFIKTDMTSKLPWLVDVVGRKMSALGQVGLPEDVAETIAFLCSRNAGGVNGQVVRVCGSNLIGA